MCWLRVLETDLGLPTMETLQVLVSIVESLSTALWLRLSQLRVQTSDTIWNCAEELGIAQKE